MKPSNPCRKLSRVRHPSSNSASRPGLTENWFIATNIGGSPGKNCCLFYAPALGAVVPAPCAAVVATYSSQPERGAEVHNRVEPIGEILAGVDEVVAAVELRKAVASA